MWDRREPERLEQRIRGRKPAQEVRHAGDLCAPGGVLADTVRSVDEVSE